MIFVVKLGRNSTLDWFCFFAFEDCLELSAKIPIQSLNMLSFEDYFLDSKNASRYCWDGVLDRDGAVKNA